MKIKALGLAAGLFFSSLLSPINADAGLLFQATRFIGLHESNNQGALKRLLGINPRARAWCGAFVAAMVRKTGRTPPAGFQMAKSWVHFGRKVSFRNAKPGDVVVLRSKRSYHVAILVRVHKGFIEAVSGNQSNSVRVSKFRTDKIVAVRR